MLPLAQIKKYRLRQMKKISLLFFAGIISAATLQARITAFGESPKYGIKPLPESAEFYDINPHTWNVFTTFDGDEIIGANQPRRTVFQIEAYSASVMEGRRVGEFTPVASLTDRGAFFGGDGYMDLYYSAPVDSKYAQQAVFFGGWKYNLTKYVDLDLGGNIIYTTKKVAGPGLVGIGGENWRGDIYAGFTSDKIFLCPFVYVGYDPTYDSLKFQGGFNPVISLEELTPRQQVFGGSAAVKRKLLAQFLWVHTGREQPCLREKILEIFCRGRLGMQQRRKNRPGQRKYGPG